MAQGIIPRFEKGLPEGTENKIMNKEQTRHTMRENFFSSCNSENQYPELYKNQEKVNIPIPNYANQ